MNTETQNVGIHNPVKYNAANIENSSQLEKSPYKLAEIAEFSGIREQSRRTVLFRRYLNTTPGEYRTSFRRENEAKADT